MLSHPNGVRVPADTRTRPFPVTGADKLTRSRPSLIEPEILVPLT